MATILPGSPPTFDRNDTSGTVKALCNYTRTLQENIDFVLGQLRKDAETTKSSIESLNAGLSGVQNSVKALGENYNALAVRVSALEQKG